MNYRKPKTYWQKRAVLAENHTYEFVGIIGAALPCIRDKLLELDMSWDRGIEKLNSEFPDEDETPEIFPGTREALENINIRKDK